jgi:hypothetical protein
MLIDPNALLNFWNDWSVNFIAPLTGGLSVRGLDLTEKQQG